MKRISSLLVGILIMMLVVSTNGFAEERPLYIGDIIEIEIQMQDITETDIREAFNDFEVIAIALQDTGYIVTLKMLEAGEETVDLKGQQIIIEVDSTLDHIERDDIFELSLKKPTTLPLIFTKSIFAISSLLFLVSGIWLLFTRIRIKKQQIHEPFQVFMEKLEMMDLTKKEALGLMTKAFKQFISDITGFYLEGMTTAELLNQLEGHEVLNSHILDIEEWLERCDFMKYQDLEISSEDIVSHKKALKALAIRINESFGYEKEEVIQ